MCAPLVAGHARPDRLRTQWVLNPDSRRRNRCAQKRLRRSSCCRPRRQGLDARFDADTPGVPGQFCPPSDWPGRRVSGRRIVCPTILTHTDRGPMNAGEYAVSDRRHLAEGESQGVRQNLHLFASHVTGIGQDILSSLDGGSAAAISAGGCRQSLQGPLKSSRPKPINAMADTQLETLSWLVGMGCFRDSSM